MEIPNTISYPDKIAWLKQILPVGSQVVVNEKGFANYENLRVLRGIPGKILSVVNVDTIHVSWNEVAGGEVEGFEGHGMNDSDSECDRKCWYLSLNQIEIVERFMQSTADSNQSIAPIPVPVPVPAIPKLKVKLYKDASWHYIWRLQIDNGPTPTRFEVFACMDKKTVTRIGRANQRKSLDDYIHAAITTYGVNPQELVDAVTQAVLAKQAIESTGVFERAVYDSEMQTMIASQPAVIAIGDMMYTLQPKAVIKGSRALAMMRDRIMGKARETAANMKVIAEKESKQIISLAEKQLEIARVKIEKDRMALVKEKSMVIPAWVIDKGVAIEPRVAGSYSGSMVMRMGIRIDTTIRAFSLIHTKTKTLGNGRRTTYQETITWDNETNKNLQPIPYLDRYHSVMVWVPFNPLTGEYDYRAASIRGGEYYLPHITEERCCMELQGLPKLITDWKSYAQVRNAIQRGNSEVNLMSLLCRYKEWHPDIQAQVPKQVMKLIDTGMYNRAENLQDSLFDMAGRVGVDKESKGVFSLDTLKRNRENSGEDLDVVIAPIALEDQLVDDGGDGGDETVSDADADEPNETDQIIDAEAEAL